MTGRPDEEFENIARDLCEGRFPKRSDPQIIPDTKERIVAAAIQFDGLTVSLPRPARHAQVLWCAEDTGANENVLRYACQGFLTSEGRFVNRVMARHIAYVAGQEPKTTGNVKELFSEDLW